MLKLNGQANSDHLLRALDARSDFKMKGIGQRFVLIGCETILICLFTSSSLNTERWLEHHPRFYQQNDAGIRSVLEAANTNESK